MTLINKIPFEKNIANDVLKMCDLFILLSKENQYITTRELKEVKKYFKKLYFNDKVELLEVLEN